MQCLPHTRTRFKSISRKKCEIDAFLDVRKLTISDTVQTFVNASILTLLNDIEVKLRDCLILPETLALISETESVINSKKYLVEREEKINGALDAIKSCY